MWPGFEYGLVHVYSSLICFISKCGMPVVGQWLAFWTANGEVNASMKQQIAIMYVH